MRKHRIAVATYFFINGFVYANWTSRLPEIQSFYGVSNAGLGTLLLIMATGALVAMPFAGWMTTKFGTQRITRFTGFFFCLVVPFLVLSNNILLLTPVFFLLGASSGAMDVAMNGQAVYVEREYNKPIMSSFHAIFSIGVALGAGSGAIFAKYAVPLFWHLGSVAIFVFICVLVATFYLIKDRPKKEEKKEGGQKFVLPSKAILPLGIIAFCGMLGEGAMADWTAIFMNKVVGQTEAFSAFSFGVFATAMTIGRLMGDHFTARFGPKELLLYDSMLAVMGMALILAFPFVYTVLIGLFMVGLGLATVVPIIYSQAGNTKGVSPSVGIAMATSIGYAGFFVGPPTIGFLGDLWNLRVGLAFVLFLFVVMLILVKRANWQN